jgi:hypothetical protein
MRHLKTYKIFESTYSDIPYGLWDDISDILLELSDDGFLTTKHFDDVKKVDNKLCEDVIEIIVDKSAPFWQKSFNYDEIEDVFNRLIDYLTSHGFKYCIFYFGEYSYIKFDSSEKINLPTEGERMLMNNLTREVLRNKTSFKISFYKNVDHV